jgi:drug/metabolite transporter (DMT)-like permease
LVTLAEREVPSSLAALVIASVPLWVIVLRALARERPPRGTFVGVFVGFAGVALLLLPGEQPRGVGFAGLALIVLAAISWATGSFMSGRLALPADPLRSSALQMLCGGAVMTVGAVAHGELVSANWSGFSAESLAAFAYLLVAGTLAFTAYVWLLQHAPISKVATYAYVNPVIAVFLGWAILEESISTATLVGAAVIVASVAFIMRKESPPAPAEGRPPGAGEAIERATA